MQEGIDNRHLQRLPHITLLNIEYYNIALKPLLAEWAYLWLQKQHLYGINKDESIQYMLEGAAARSDATVKITLIDLAISKLKIINGLESPIVRPTLAHQKSMNSEELSRNEERIMKIKSKQYSFDVDDDDFDYQELINFQLEELNIAKLSALEHQNLVNDIYILDEKIDLTTRDGTYQLQEIQGAISILNKKILELECPRDDSLDNTVIVWYSQAFAITAGIASTNLGLSNSINQPSGNSSVPNICSQIEDLGYTVKCCSDADEAISRVRDLHNEGRLRCLIIGGDEVGLSCGPSCIKIHDSETCLRCGEDWSNHNGHVCLTIGGRGTWKLDKIDQSDKKSDTLQIVKNLTDSENSFLQSQPILPALRTAIYSAHMNLKEDERMEFWKLGSTVTEDSKQLVTWVHGLPKWNVEKKMKDVEDDEDDGDDNDQNDVTSKNRNVKRKIESSHNADKILLTTYKQELLQLELKKSTISDKDEFERKKLQSQITEKHTSLELSVQNRINILDKAELSYKEMIDMLKNSCVTEDSNNNTNVNDDKSTANSDEASSSLLVSSSLQFKSQNVGSHSARDAALAIGWLQQNHNFINDRKQLIKHKSLLQKYRTNINNEISFLNRMLLAAKVVAHVKSPILKKILNLCQNWLRTYLPHCLAKINRVSFGLLSTEDCKKALSIDPFVPRSRLKLSVPFIGKDVPSRSSEFAHPDVIIGLTILAYRYTGLRKDDFIDIIDNLTSRFSQEIGPARDRESSIRHEKWIFASGGAIRGLKTTRDGKVWNLNKIDDSASGSSSTNASTTTTNNNNGNNNNANEEQQKSNKEVVQLKFLQKSNKEQMNKLYELVRYEPLVIHHYLQNSVFPQFMRSQKLKISASGQAVGGDILVGKRVGFSGTPSDLLPQELGRCDYETGDDGMMLTTCLDRQITSYEYIDDHWNVEFLLQRIAMSENPRYHALIDTGALITGYSNKEVAQQLLDRGLSWCDGIVFLDDEDRQQVLVRATGRVVSADQCGVALERRFAFYDQIHTTGMDIKHVVNATAVITLGR